MRDALKASGDWYFDGPGWIIMMLVVAPLIAWQGYRRPKFWWPVFVVVVVVMPLGLLLLAR